MSGRWIAPAVEDHRCRLPILWPLGWGSRAGDRWQCTDPLSTGERCYRVWRVVWGDGRREWSEEPSTQDLLNSLRPLVYRVVNATAADDAELTENVDAIMAFVDLAREHPDPKRLLPRGDRLGDWLPPGTPVVVHLGGSEYQAVVEPARDRVTVRLSKINVVTEYPRDLISREGEPWTPPKLTNS